MSTPPASGARERILARIRGANLGRSPIPHPGTLPSGIEPPVPFRGSDRTGPVDAFEDRFLASGGEVIRLAGEEAAREWLGEFSRGFASVAVCWGVHEALHPKLPEVPPAEAALGVSMAVGAAAQTGSLLVSSKEGRRPQILPPVTLIWVRAEQVLGTLGEALGACRTDLPAVIALHSGPSKSADIGQILVRGVHGPGRIVAAVLEAPTSRP